MKFFIFLLLIVLNTNLLAVDYYFQWEDYAVTMSSSPDYIANYTTDGFSIYYHIGTPVPTDHLTYNGTGLTEGNSPVDVGNPVGSNSIQVAQLRNFDATKEYTLCIVARAMVKATSVIEKSLCSNTVTIPVLGVPSTPTNLRFITTIIDYLENHGTDRSVDDICVEAMEYALNINIEKSSELDTLIQVFKKHNKKYIDRSDKTVAAKISNAYQLETYGEEAKIILDLTPGK